MGDNKAVKSPLRARQPEAPAKSKVSAVRRNLKDGMAAYLWRLYLGWTALSSGSSVFLVTAIMRSDFASALNADIGIILWFHFPKVCVRMVAVLHSVLIVLQTYQPP
jgi:hypothetical protein